VAEVGLACACKNRCEAGVAQFQSAINRAPMPARNIPVDYSRLTFLLGLGAVFVWAGSRSADPRMKICFIALGALFSFFSIFQFFYTRRLSGKTR
jgi:hypothetical protein